MPKTFTKLSLLLSALLLVGCVAKGPVLPQVVAVQTPAPVVNPALLAEFNAALSLLKNGESDEAMAAFEALSIQQPPLAGTHLNLALIHYQRGKYAQALLEVDTSLDISPGSAQAHNLRGSLLRISGRFQEAELAYAFALANRQDYAPSHLNMAILLDLYLQDWPRASLHYQRYLSLTGEAPNPSAETNKLRQQAKLWQEDLQMRMQQGQL